MRPSTTYNKPFYIYFILYKESGDIQYNFEKTCTLQKFIEPVTGVFENVPLYNSRCKIDAKQLQVLAQIEGGFDPTTEFTIHLQVRFPLINDTTNMTAYISAMDDGRILETLTLHDLFTVKLVNVDVNEPTFMWGFRNGEQLSTVSDKGIQNTLNLQSTVIKPQFFVDNAVTPSYAVNSMCYNF